MELEKAKGVVFGLAIGDALGFLDAFFWWLQSHFAKKRVWVVAPYDSREEDFDLRWDECLHGNFIAMGSDETGDLSEVTKKKELKVIYTNTFSNHAKGKQAQNSGTLWRFAKEMNKGDLVIARRGRNEAIGIGTVNQEYRFEPGRKDFKHVVGVNWEEDFTPKQVSSQFGMHTVYEVTRLAYEEVLRKTGSDKQDNGNDKKDIAPDIRAISSLISEYRNIILEYRGPKVSIRPSISG